MYLRIDVILYRLLVAFRSPYLEINSFHVCNDIILFLQKGWSPLHSAAQNGHSNVVEKLIKSEANINATTTVRQLHCQHFKAVNYITTGRLDSCSCRCWKWTCWSDINSNERRSWYKWWWHSKTTCPTHMCIILLHCRMDRLLYMLPLLMATLKW